MESRSRRLSEFTARRIRSRAARWVADMHGPGADSRLKERLRVWLGKDPRHAAAYARAEQAWKQSGELIAQIPRDQLLASPRRLRRTRWLGPALSGAGVACVAVIAVVLLLARGTESTGPGERKTIELADGTQVSLNANSRLLIEFDARVRQVTLVTGEAVFDVAKGQPRPFVVVVGDNKVVAVGTSFLVRREEPAGRAFAVTLVDGRVAVEPIAAPDVGSLDITAGQRLLDPGERLRLDDQDAVTVDSPSIERLTAWRRGLLILDNTTIREAAREFNRYGPKTLVIDSPTIGELRVGGVFKIDDPESFAQSMANLHFLRVFRYGNKIVLTDKKRS